jgi:phosphoribosylanthranilate isomerase
MQGVDEALNVIKQGVDHIGVTPSSIGLPGEVSFDAARSIVDAVKSRAVSVALSVETDLDAIMEMVDTVRPDILHLCGLQNTLDPEAVGRLRDQLPGLAIMQAISVEGPQALDIAKAYEPVVEYLLLDTQDPKIAGIGASGVTHDWSISREIVQQIQIPVILAGGLSPENVAEAVKIVKPWGVDSLTHTNKKLADGGFRKNIDRVGQFVRVARGL